MVTGNFNQVWQTVETLNQQDKIRLLQKLLQTFYQQVSEQAEAPLEKQSIRGKYAFVQTSSEEFAQRKAQEIVLE